MMAHEIPLQVHHNTAPGAKARKPKPVHHAKILLPNGEKPDFGSGQKEKPVRSPQLPNGDKPDFGCSDHKNVQGNKQSGGKRTRKSSGKKTGVTIPTCDAAEEMKNSEGKECYAGSSFHSSPEALALPKPSFVVKSSELTLSPTANIQARPPVNASPRTVLNVPPAFVYQGMPCSGPPRYPVTAHPPSSASGFDYNANQQGFINNAYPQAAIPQPPLPMQSYPLQTYPPIPPPSSTRQPSGQKITFNELIGSSQ